ncbi:MAG: Gfo/Idh/MocA family oxidoreductase [Candidatus Omnitrophica bacterium]|nr:Gfo/Idh/MocA family oxidoreductase [Candidatus Omnitrophota bacterium]
MKKINVGLIGYKFMGKAHSHAYLDMPKFFKPKAYPVMKVICGRDEQGVRQVQENWGWEGYETSWEKVVQRDDVDLIDITTPNNSHKEMAIAAAENGKDIFCEKPLAMNVAEAKEMVKAVEKAGVKHMVCFNYRRVPAIGLAKRLIDEGRLGTIYHIRATYLQDWIVDPDFPLVWRLKKEEAGSGVHGDLNAHIIDLARYLVGEFKEVVGMQETFIKERYLPREGTKLFAARASKKKGKVTVDDTTIFLARFKNGSVGTFEATRFATGRKNFNRIELNGSKGSLVFNFEQMNELEFYSKEDPCHIQGFRRILATEPTHPYVGAWWPPGHIIGYEHTFVNSVYDLMNYIADDKMPSPNFIDGLRCQEVLDAVELSCKERTWIKV